MAGQGPDQQRLVLRRSLPVHQGIAARASAPDCGHHTGHRKVCAWGSAARHACASLPSLSNCRDASGTRPLGDQCCATSRVLQPKTISEAAKEAAKEAASRRPDKQP
jgi:hypothetical protein